MSLQVSGGFFPSAAQVAAGLVYENNGSVGSYIDLTTAGPAVTLTANTSVLVLVSCETTKTTTGGTSYMSFALSGANTLAASDTNCTAVSSSLAGGVYSLSGSMIITGLTPGSTTFTAKYKSDSGTFGFANRRIVVIPLN